MTDEEIQKAKESFLRMGVAEKSIFSEIMRARYLDYNLFLNPTNAEYGVTIESLYENMKLTSDKFGDYPGNEEAYANVYTLAMRINPMDFATGVTKAGDDLRGLIEFVISEAKQSGKTILFAGADHYIYMLPKIFYDLNDCRIAVAVKSEVWKKNLSNLFPRGRIMLEKEIFHDEELYDYIFFFEKDSLKMVPLLKGHLFENAKMNVVLPYTQIMDTAVREREIKRTIAKEKSLAGYYDFPFENDEFVLLEIIKGNSGPVTFGEAVIKDGILQKTKLFSIGADQFFEADDWNYDVYAYNSSTALQAVLSAHVVDMGKPIEKEFFLVEKKKISSGRILKVSKAAILEDTGLCTDLIEELSISRPITGIEVKNGDLLLVASRNRVYTAVVYNEQGTMVADAAITVIRSKGKYTGEYIKMYLDGPVGTLFLEAIHAGDALGLKRSRLMRIPFPDAPKESISTVTELCRTSVERLSAAAANWRESKKRAVQLMMGKS